MISGGRDLTTPPAVAQRIAALIPNSVLVDLPTAGHSILDTRERSALEIVKAVYAGRANELPTRAAELDAAPSELGMRLLTWAIGAAAVAESAVPAAVPRAVRRVTAS